MDIEHYSQIFWESITIEFTIKFLLIYFFIVWIFLILWVARDISYRSPSLLFQLFCVFLMIIMTPIGAILYLIIRPRKKLYEQCSDEIETNLEILYEIVENRIYALTYKQIYCPECAQAIEKDSDVCPHCSCELRKKCKSCKENIRKTWGICPYCMTEQKEISKKKSPPKKKASTTQKTKSKK